ncbi:dihydroxyacetone kinase Dak1 [Penicillium chermesinum]|uniref:Dihydroxyacetone kinase Dak1 n=1 Tax=Penicillium chermesinum TaxID=63820 RepID=A0A9W9PIS8_9EURO|nr:dihydroxyacetone kinase Dak1 [Penicillium chermesinum]KAJ5247609.1 dihydroxyacetone kinase Dak1 [Penicillium chermesinum]
MQSKHFFSDAGYLGLSALNSYTLTNPSLGFDPENKVVFRRDTDTRKPKVSIVTGGGSGHEPAFAGFVGHGVCDAAIAGTIFASPSTEQIRNAVLDRVPTEKGVLVIPMNYTGDVLNFGVAVEKANAAGVRAEFFVMGDDVSVGRKKGGKVGRRGIAGSVLIIKLAGALAEAGGNIDEIQGLLELARSNLVSVGSSLEHVHIPGRGESELDEVPDGHIELGMGIHNEAGSKRIKATLPEVVSIMLKQLLDQNDPDRSFLKYDAGDEFVLLINNLGGVSPLEIAGLTNEVYKHLQKDYSQLKIVRVIQGTFLTSLNGLGFSISLLRLVDTGLGSGKSMLELLEAPSDAIGWTTAVSPSVWKREYPPVEFKKTTEADTKPTSLKVEFSTLKKILSAGIQRLIKAEPNITRYDSIVGDGDCGVGLRRGAEAVQALLDHDKSLSSNNDVVKILERIVGVVEKTMDGTSGALYAIFLNSLVAGLRAQDAETKPVSTTTWARALDHSVEAVGKYTPAQVGDRTMMDALLPFCTTLQKGDVHAAAAAAEAGAEATKHMQANLGRTVYVGGEDEWLGQIPDPGAYGLSEFLQGIASAL